MMSKSILFVFTFSLLMFSCKDNDSAEYGDYKKVISLNGTWQFLASNDVQIEDLIEASYSAWDTLQVPGNWDTRDRYSEYVGKGYYQREFNVPENWDGKQIRIKFDAVYERSKVWLNGTLLGEHVGGYTPFEFNITDIVNLEENNSVLVEADNTYKRGAWWAWGGISRNVSLEAHEDVRLVYQHITSTPNFETNKVQFTVKYKIENNSNNAITTQVQSNIVDVAKPEKISVNINAGGTKIAVLKFTEELSKVKLWHFNTPNLYEFNSTLSINGKVIAEKTDNIGIRKFEVKGEQFYLNNEAVRMNGVNRVHDHPDFGNTEPYHLVKQDMLDLKSLGCNFSRLMHAPLSKNLLKFCDSIGFLVVEEIPVWGDDDEQAFPNNPLTERWMKEMIERDFNNPSIVAWSVGNELRNPGEDWSDKALTKAQYSYVDSMLDYVATLDNTRLKTYVTITSYRKGEIGTEPYEKVDFISMNSYGNAPVLAEKTHKKFPGKPIFISEIGIGQIGAAPHGKLSDELVDYLKKLKTYPYVTGVSLWSYNDYRSNYKGTPLSGFREWGIVDARRNKKEAYSQLKEIYKYWQE
ncbi:glycoside hydrolase family 2 [Algibacter amylolyticus]|uniref:Glycoside hydrolase family 2 n=1 Tax=Algibacter amylolyticus TaxID=1608400 RepID=A0A5M7B604_9FLAO|nr:glycoside hydrolase family 2 TIM barrel-domain containing protein [Algibacter amylolyticus]KAA5823748.1 glycoside hydrolase family 2 [Algibacter amylolyticus]MBB5267919.1 beta-galactosidase/beta-glucuronidase [Algibacter amylolyticus]TSJ74236.1 glycoside hydrolase family 2 [Algibacter amylolyticus]